MSFDTEWLHRITNEVAKAPAPEPDWDRIEHKLFMRITRHPLPRPVAHVCPPWCALLGIAAVAATLTLAVATVLNSSPVARPPPLGACAARTVVPSDLGALAPLRTGDTLDASSRQMTVHHGGWVTFTLDPGSHACIDALDDGMDLQLLQGRIAAKVTPGSVPDRFTVRVGQTRVAVHGTVFSVEKHDNRVLVRVDHGSVAVGPVGRTGGTTGWLLIAPASGSFSTDGAQAARFDIGVPSAMPKPGAGEPRTPQRVPAPTGTAGTPTTPSPAHGRSKPALPAASEPQSASRPSLPAPPPPLPVRLDALLASGPVGHLVQSVRACYRDNTPAPTGVTVRVETSIRIEVAPDGHVAFAHFDPPLAPKAQLCASAVVAHTQFPRAQLASTLNVPLTL